MVYESELSSRKEKYYEHQHEHVLYLPVTNFWKNLILNKKLGSWLDL